MARGVKGSGARSAKDIATELDEIGGALSGAYGRQILRLAAELRGETIEPTENERREAELAAEAGVTPEP